MSAAGVNGARPDIVLLHGWGTTPHVWREVAPLLDRHFRVHAPGLPYSGEVQSHDAGTVEAIAERVAAWAPKACMVCGWSLGGAVALAWARRAPRQVARLALIATNPCFVQRADWPHGLEARAVHDFARGLVREPAAVLTRYITLQARGDVRAARVVRHLRQTLSQRPHQPDAAALQLGLTLLLRTDLRSVLPHITQPALLIHGARDRVVPLAAGEYLAQRLPNGRISLMANAAHAPFASDPEDACAQLARFFDER